MKKRKVPFVIIFIALFVTAVAAMFYAGISTEINVLRAMQNTRAEFDARLDGSPLAVLTGLPDYAQTEATLRYKMLDFNVQLVSNDEIFAVGGGLLGNTLYGVRHDLGALSATLATDIATVKPEYRDEDDGSAQTVTYRFTNAQYGEVTAVFTVRQRRITHIDVTSDALTAQFDFGDNHSDDWLITINGTTVVWRSEFADGHAVETFTVNSTRTVALDWDTYSGGLTLQIDDMRAYGSLVIGAEDFHLQFNGDGALTLTLSGKKGDSRDLTAYEFIDVRDDLEAFGETFWFAFEGLYEYR